MIKRFLVLIAALILAVNIYGQSASNNWYTDFDKAVAAASSQNKPLMLFFTGSDWCGWCKKIQKEVFVDKAFETWAKKNVILVEVDFPRKVVQTEQLKKQNASLQAQLSVQGYPTIHFVKMVTDKNVKKLSAIGSMYYQPGGAAAFIKSADQIIKKK